MLILLSILVIICYIRYRPSFDTTDNGDVLLWYYDFIYKNNHRVKIRTFLKIKNVLK